MATLLGAVVLALMAASTLLTVAFTDYEAEALPAVSQLTAGHLGGFLGALPAYGGSLILRAPLALAAHAAGGGELAVYRVLALPCLAAALLFGVHLFTRLAPRDGRTTLAPWLALGVVVANPLIIPALDTGHPEELLGAVLCAAGVMAAFTDRPVAAGVLLGLAGANKAWAVLAVLPALVALRHGRVTLVLVAGAVCGAVMAPALLHGTAATGSARTFAAQGSQIFQPWQWSWFLGHHGAVVHGLYGAKVGYRTGPGWVFAVGHLPVLAAPLAAAALAVAARIRREDALVLLALCFFLRCVVDPWDTAYYHLPLVMALAAHEVVARRRAPAATLAMSVAIYGATVIARDHLTPDGQAALYLLWSLPVGAALAAAVFAPARWAAFSGRLGARAAAALPSLAGAVTPAGQPTTVSSLLSPLSTSCPPSVTATRSSMRTPTAPGT